MTGSSAQQDIKINAEAFSWPIEFSRRRSEPGATRATRLVARRLIALPSLILLPLVQRWIPLALIGFVALWLRTCDLARRPMHADEANQAVKTGELLEHGAYVYDPADHHGPTLYYAVLPVAWLRGQHSLATLTETTVRLVPALAGTVAVLLLAALAAPLGRGPALIAAGLMAVSPPAVYYSRYFIQETLLVAFTLAAFVCASQWWRQGKLGWALATGACLGLMQATKASAGLFLLAAALAAVLAPARSPASSRRRRDGLFAAGAALVVWVLFQSSFGTNPAGIRDAFTALGRASTRLAGGSGHEKPWTYYLGLFGWQRVGGVLWEQMVFSALACGGLGVAAFTRQPFLRWAAFYTLVIVTVFSLTPYKTPWHAIHFVPGLALLAAGALAAIRRLHTGRIVAAAVGFGCVASLTHQTWRAAFIRPADERNPYAYVHSSPDVLKFRALADAALADFPDRPVRIISEEYWPLPWYLRGLPSVGYWSAPPADCDGTLVIASAAQAGTVRARLQGRYQESILGLRPGVLCVVFTAIR